MRARDVPIRHRQQAISRVLCVTPQSLSSGEALSALQLARDVRRSGGRAHFVCSPFTARLVGPQLETPPVVLSGDLRQNQAAFWAAFRQLSPEIVVFADFSSSPPSAGGVSLVDEPFVSALGACGAALATFDHLGFADGGTAIGAALLPIPRSMRRLRPCPPNDPAPGQSDACIPFRPWAPPAPSPPAAREAIRARFLGPSGGSLVFHAVPRWAEEMCRRRKLPYYGFLPQVLASYLAGSARPITLVSVNQGDLLPPVEGAWLRIVNAQPLAPDEFDRLLMAADLVMSENCLSATLGKAVCAGIPAVLWRNSFDETRALDCLTGDTAAVVRTMIACHPGTTFPWVAFPYWRQDMVRSLSTFAHGAYAAALVGLEIYGGTATAQALEALLFDEAARERLHHDQLRLARRLAALPTAYSALCASPSPAAAGSPAPFAEARCQ